MLDKEEALGLRKSAEERCLDMIRTGIDERIALQFCGVNQSTAKRIGGKIAQARKEGAKRVTDYETQRMEAMSRPVGKRTHEAEAEDFRRFRQWKDSHAHMDRDAIVENEEVKQEREEARLSALPPIRKRLFLAKRKAVVKNRDGRHVDIEKPLITQPRDWLDESFKPHQGKGRRRPIKIVSITQIRRVVGKRLRVPAEHMMGCQRRRECVRARQIAFYLSRHLTQASLPLIGKMFGGKDHTTVLHGVRRIEKLMASHPEIADLVNELRDRITGTEGIKETLGEQNAPDETVDVNDNEEIGDAVGIERPFARRGGGENVDRG